MSLNIRTILSLNIRTIISLNIRNTMSLNNTTMISPNIRITMSLSTRTITYLNNKDHYVPKYKDNCHLMLLYKPPLYIVPLGPYLFNPHYVAQVNNESMPSTPVPIYHTYTVCSIYHTYTVCFKSSVNFGIWGFRDRAVNKFNIFPEQPLGNHNPPLTETTTVAGVTRQKMALQLEPELYNIFPLWTKKPGIKVGWFIFPPEKKTPWNVGLDGIFAFGGKRLKIRA